MKSSILKEPMEKHPQSTRRNNPILEEFFIKLSKLVYSDEIMFFRSMSPYMNLVTSCSKFPQVNALSLSFTSENFFDPRIIYQTSAKIYNGPVVSTKVEQASRNMYGNSFTEPTEKINSSIVVPVELSNNKFCVLVLCVRGKKDYTEADLQVVQQIAAENKYTFENAINFWDTHIKGIVAEELFTIQQAISKNFSEEIIHQLIVDQACFLSFSRTAILLLQRKDDLIVAASSGVNLPGFSPGENVIEGKFTSNDLGERFGDSFVLASLPTKSEPLGFLVAIDKKIGVFDDYDSRSINMLASAASIGLENAALIEKTSQISILEERERLANEFHDSLGQSISFLKMESSLIQKHVSERKCAQAEAELLQHNINLDDTFLMVRMAIFNLRFPLDENTGFLSVIKDYIKEFSNRSGIRVELQNDVISDPLISFDTKLQLIRIFQEALSNARRHAKSTLINVRFTRENKQIVLEIEDNGKGFLIEQLEKQKKDHYGLQIMQERAKSFGGRVNITSQLEKGTIILVEAPEEYQE